ncbi:hypothetical protein, partial [Marinobacter sp.]|uniref:hypothetical protein n=1 Tax=Marinobacter sp. TaxID=50741 RepID=UPI002B471205
KTTFTFTSFRPWKDLKSRNILLLLAFFGLSFGQLQAQDDDVIITSNAELIFPACVESVDYFHLFTVIDANDEGTPAISDLDGNVALNSITLIESFQRDDLFYRVFEAGFTVQAGNYSDIFTITYEGESLEPAFDVTQEAGGDPQIVFNPQTLTLPACVDAIDANFGVTIISCDETANQPTFNFLGQDFTPGFSQADDGYFRYTVSVPKTAAGNQVATVSYTDNEGNTTSIPFLVSVVVPENQPADINLPGNLTFTLPSCSLEETVTFSIQITDDCDDINPGNAEFFLDGAEIFPTFTNAAQGYFEFTETITEDTDGDLLLATYTDSEGASSAVDGLLTVLKQDLNLDEIGCNDQVNVTLNDETCTKIITPDMVGEGDVCDTDDRLRVIVYDGIYNGDPDNEVDACGVFNYVLMYGDEEYCWGVINAEDKTPPVVYCPRFDYDGLYKYLDDDGNTQFSPNLDEDWFEDDDGFRELLAFNELICDDIDKVVDVKASWNDPSYEYYTGVAKAVDACSGELAAPIKVEDHLEEFECRYDEYGGYGEYAAVLLRTFYFEDEKGNQESCTQRILFSRPYIHLPVCKVHVNACEFDGELTTDDLLDNDPYSVPFYVNGVCDTIYFTPDPSESGTYTTKGHNCNYTISYTDQVFPGPDNCGNKIVRTWSILDWCWNPSLGEYPALLGRPMDDYRDDLYACYDFYDDWDDDLQLARYHVKKSDWSDKKFSWEQHIIYADEEAPEVTCVADDLDWDGQPDGDRTIRISTGPFNCTAVVDLEDRIDVTDNCSVKRWRFRLEGFEKDPKTGLDVPVYYGWTDWTSYALAGVAVGEYELIVEAEDDCGNLGYANCTVIVEDQVEPVAVCDDELNISIGGPGTTNDGLARVTAADVDEGSWDNCELAELDVRRDIEETCLDIYADQVNGLVWASADYKVVSSGGRTFYIATRSVAGKGVVSGDTLVVKEADGTFFSWWANEVYFTCCDISADSEDLVTIELRATDAEGNSNVCWLNTLIEDKLPPSCDVHDKTILCTELDFDPADSAQVAGRFGAPEDVIEIRDNCGATITEEVIWTPDDCGTGLIERVFTITDASGRSTVCTQEIEVLEVNDYEIVFPGDDGSAECGVEPDRDISTQSFACDILAVNKDTTRFQASGDECFKLLITYRVINWCEYDGVSTTPIEVPRDWDGDNDLTEDHVIRVQPDGDLLPNVSGQQVVTWTQADGDQASLTAAEYADLTPGFWQYSQLLKIYDDVAPEVEVENESLEFCAYGTPPDDCGGNVNIVFTVSDICTP